MATDLIFCDCSFVFDLDPSLKKKLLSFVPTINSLVSAPEGLFDKAHPSRFLSLALNMGNYRGTKKLVVVLS